MNCGPQLKSQGKSSPRISDAEWTVMKVVWRLRSATARQVVEALEREADWKPKTIHTLLRRLVKKGAVTSGKVGREYIFKPAVGEHECCLAASRSFLDRVFDGKIAPFLANFLDNEKLSGRQIEELKKLLEEKEK